MAMLVGQREPIRSRKDKTIEGNWFRLLKREGGGWKIVMESLPALPL
jgi:hypothetical protein